MHLVACGYINRIASFRGYGRCIEWTWESFQALWAQLSAQRMAWTPMILHDLCNWT